MKMPAEERYQTDAQFRNLVDMLHACIHRADFSPTEIREAAMLAQIHYEMRNPRPLIFQRVPSWFPRRRPDGER